MQTSTENDVYHELHWHFGVSHIDSSMDWNPKVDKTIPTWKYWGRLRTHHDD